MKKKPRIILLEDRPEDAELVLNEVKKIIGDFKTITVQTQTEFEKQLVKFEPDLILADYRLKGFTGIDALGIVRQTDPDLPFIFVTGSLDEETAVDCIKRGATDYVLKTNLIRLGPAVQRALASGQERAHLSSLEKALHREEMKFRRIVEQLSETVFIVDSDGVVKYASPATRFDGYEPEELMGHSIFDYAHVNDRVFLKEEFRKTMLTTQITWRECRLITKDQKTRWLRVTTRRIQEEGQVTGILGTIADITKQKEALQALQKSEEQYRLLADNATDMITIHTVDGQFTFVSPACTLLFGYQPAELLKISPIELIHPDDAPKMQEKFQNLIDTGGVTVIDYRLRHKNGNYIWAETTAKFLLDPLTGKTTQVIAVTRDISEHLFHQMADNISDGLAIIENGKVIYHNQQMCQIFHCQPEDLTHFDIYKFAAPEEHDRIAKIIQNARQTGQEPAEVEYWIISHDGKRRYIHNRYTYIRENGQIIRRYVVTTDMTDRHLSEEIIRQVNNRLETLLQAIPDLIYFKDAQGKNILVNRAFLDFTGLSQEQVLGKTDAEILPASLAEACRLSDEKVKKEKKAATFEERYTDQQGNQCIFETTKIPLFDSQNNILGLVGISHDITDRKMIEDKERRIKNIYQKAISNARGVPYLLNYSTDSYDFMGSGCKELFGVPAEEMTPARLRQMVVEQRIIIPGVINNKEACERFKAGQIDRFQADSKIITQDGKERWYNDSAIPVFNEKTGKVTGSLGILQDITERRRQETIQHLLYQIANAVNETKELDELLKLIRQALSTVIDTTNFFFALYDRATDTLSLPLFIDEKDQFEIFPAGRTLTGYVIHTDQPLLVHEEDMERMTREGLVDLVGTCSKVWIGVPVKVQDEVIGAVVVQSYTSASALDETDLEVLKFVSEQIGTSVARKRAEISLRESEERFRSIFEDSPLGIALYDTKGTLLKGNTEYFHLLGISGTTDLGKYNLFDNPGLTTEHKKALFDKIPIRFEQSLDFDAWVKSGFPGRRSGRVYFNVLISPLHTTDSVISYLVQLQDITERKIMERELIKNEKLESVGILAGGIAHDFNNILTALLGNVTLARMYATNPPKIIERLNEAEKAAMRARELTQRLLTFSKGGQPMKKITTLKNALSESVLLSLSGSKTRPELGIADELWNVDIDEGQITQVFNNLIINADQAMPNGGILKVKAGNLIVTDDKAMQLPAGDYIRITFTDQGEGIPPENLVKIFDPYFTTKKGGSGLGLATAYSIIKNHNGKIEVESTPGAGSTFTIYLPAYKVQMPSPAESCKPEISGSGRILVMDDDDVVREIASDMISSLGYDVVTVSDGNEALQKYREAREAQAAFDVVIMDLTVPGGLGGKETIVRLREVDPQVKAIVSSGYSNDPIMSRYQAFGFRGVVAKPYSLAELSRVLKQVIEEK